MPAPSLAVLAVAALLGGAAAGVGLERAGVLSPLDEPEAAADVRRDVVDVLDCPDGTVVAALTRGDRVVATGRSDDGVWLEIRSPLGLDDRVWLPAATVSPDADRSALDDLPERECERDRPTTTTASTSTTTTSTSTSTTVPGLTTTTEPPPVPTTTRPPTRPTTTTTTSPDVQPPVLGTVQRSQSLIYEEFEGFCPGIGGPTTSVISVSATDDRPGLTVSMTYSFNPGAGIQTGPLNAPTQQRATFSATLGPFPTDTLDVSQAPITVTVVARDSSGNVDQAATVVDLTFCGPG